MANETEKPGMPKSAVEIARTLAKDTSLVEELGKMGQLDVRKYLPLSMQLEDALKQNRSARESLTDLLKSASLTDQLKNIGLGQARASLQSHSLEISPAPSDASIRSASDIGTAVRTVRKAKGLTQQDFAGLAGVGRRFLSELESGKPTLEIGKVLKVAAAAGFQIKMVPVGQTDE